MSQAEIIAEEAVKALIKANLSVSFAESCTGGMIATLLTSVPGASAYYYGSVVSYDNSVKINTLKVNEQTISEYGAVSRECVEEMAQGVRKLLGTDYAIATSGIAGPNGGTPDKPAGTVWIAVAGEDFTCSKKLTFKGSRKLNIDRFSSNAINFLRCELLQRKKKQ